MDMPDWAMRCVKHLASPHMEQGGDWPPECWACHSDDSELAFHEEACDVRRLLLLVGGDAEEARMRGAIRERAERVAAMEAQRAAYEARKSATEKSLDEASRRMAEAMARATYGWVDYEGEGQPWPPARGINPGAQHIGPASRLRRG